MHKIMDSQPAKDNKIVIDLRVDGEKLVRDIREALDPPSLYEDPQVPSLALSIMQIWEESNASYDQMCRAFEEIRHCSRYWPRFDRRPKQAEKPFSEDTEVVVVDRELPAMCRLVNFATGVDRKVKLIPKAMWNDYLNKRQGHTLLPVDQEYVEPELQEKE